MGRLIPEPGEGGLQTEIDRGTEAHDFGQLSPQKGPAPLVDACALQRLDSSRAEPKPVGHKYHVRGPAFVSMRESATHDASKHGWRSRAVLGKFKGIVFCRDDERKACGEGPTQSPDAPLGDLLEQVSLLVAGEARILSEGLGLGRKVVTFSELEVSAGLGVAVDEHGDADQHRWTRRGWHDFVKSHKRSVPSHTEHGCPENSEGAPCSCHG